MIIYELQWLTSLSDSGFMSPTADRAAAITGSTDANSFSISFLLEETMETLHQNNKKMTPLPALQGNTRN